MLKRIAISDLRIGMYINEFCGSWMDHPFWRSQFSLKSEKDLRRILESGMTELWIDTSKGLDVDESVHSVSLEEVERETNERLAKAASHPVSQQVPLEQEYKRAMNLCIGARDAVMEMFTDARMGKALDFERAEDLVEGIAQSVRRHPDALISLARLKQANEYTYMHSVAVAALMTSLAREMGLNDEQVRDAGLAGLLHDIGKMTVPQEVLDKPGKLNDDEFASIRKHPEAGYQILRRAGKVSDAVLDVSLHHHEKVDGSGYPHHLQGDQISLLAKMGAVCDVYDAITSARAYKPGWDPAESIRKMAEWRGHFDWDVFQAFVKTVGIYPVGSLVRLESGRLAVVIEQNANALMSPKVKVFFSARSKVPIPQLVIDLSKRSAQDKIVGRESPSAWGFVNFDELWAGDHAVRMTQ